jgi:acetyl-CoA acyltransferase
MSNAFQKTSQAYIVSAVRTPVGRAYRGYFAKTRPDDMLAFVLSELKKTVPGLDSEQIEDVMIGCAMPEAEQGMNVARIAALLAGYSDRVPGYTVNRFCSSGLQSIALAAQQIEVGAADVIVAGGVESMSAVPMGGYSYRLNPIVFEKEACLGIAYGMGITAEYVAERWKVSRQAQDAFALQSHTRACAAIAADFFKEEIVPYPVIKRALGGTSHEGDLHVSSTTLWASQDEGPRADTHLEALAALPTVFKRQGTVTAGNTSQMSDGAAAVLMMSEAALKRYGVQPLARFCGFKVAGVPPEMMGIGPIEAIPLCLKQADVSIEQIDWIELNEAFAAQSLAVINTLGLDPACVNPQGGAIALGHPLGATGAIRAATLIHGLRRTKKRYGLVTMCIGTGMGAAGLFEAL